MQPTSRSDDPCVASSIAPRLPRKKRARSDDSGNEAELPAASVPVVLATPPAPVPVKRENLLAKWAALASSSAFNIPPPALPEVSFVDDVTSKFTLSRERLAAARVLRGALISTFQKVKKATEAKKVNHEAQTSLCSLLQTNFGFHRSTSDVKHMLKVAERWQNRWENVPTARVSSMRQWFIFLGSQHGPFCESVPTLSMVSQWDEATSNNLLHALLTILYKGPRREPLHLKSSGTGNEGTGEDDNEGEESKASHFFVNDEDDDDVACADKGMDPFLPWDEEEAFPSGLSNEVVDLLRFLRILMPTQRTQSVSTSSSEAQATSGVGVWLYSVLCVADLQLDPDTHRALHSLFRAVSQHIKTLHSDARLQSHAALDDKRGTLLSWIASKSASSKPKSYWSIDDVDVHDLRALYTLLIILAKAFHQNQNHLVPL